MNRALVRILARLGKLVYYLRLYPLVMWLNRREAKVLLYHACEAEESDWIRGLRSNTPPAVFGLHLDFLQRHYTVVSPAVLARGPAPPRAVTITFDDGYRSVYTHAFPLLLERSMSATVYLITSVLDGDGLVWVTELNWYLRRRPQAARAAAAAALGTGLDASAAEILDRARRPFDPVVIQRMLDELSATDDRGDRFGDEAHRLYLTWEEVLEMRDRGMTFGAHTRTHPSLPRLEPASMEDEIAGSRDRIADALGSCDSMAYPFGDGDARTRTVATACGFQSIMEVGGTNRPLDARSIARIPVCGKSHAELFAEIEVVAPIKALAKRWLGVP